MTQPNPGTPRLLRAINDRAALQVLLERGPLTRPEIGALTGLSKPTASQLLARLQKAGLVVPNGVREGLPGRTAEVYRLNPAAAHVAALDITPGHIDVEVADITGTVIGGHRLPVPAPRTHDAHGLHDVQDAPDIQDVRHVQDVQDTVEGVRAALEGAGVPGSLRRVVAGVRGASGPRSGETGHDADESVPGRHSPGLVAALGAGLGVRICVENNVNLAAWAEQALGVARGRSDFVLLWAGESLGSALVLGGRLHRGATGGAGEVARLPVPGVPVPGVPLPRQAGHHGGYGYQALAGGPAVLAALRSYGVPGATFEQAVRNAVRDAEDTGRHSDEARAGLRDVAARLAAGLASIVSVVDPELVVLAGGTFLAGGETLRALVERELYGLTGARPPLLLSAVEGNPVLAGALDLALTATREEVFSSTAPV